ncbi:endonuclease YncB(thermonuclease family) [Actinoplanes lutulentus]|uniref:Lamin tail-like protein n=1 Tax=Actinoplanes lutulentus TaxID=1287878 RepID=A0A327ZJH6_9ACTN|nr:lamin tail domain-containing protein [Actinoplanes lutulentus]MBB2944373.1 endonuclease YncB(thermonuclease family) [Actinoplanes lutulentus]RAK42395.1 lamin tail-like protein [Actinoplanes lutulentus]
MLRPLLALAVVATLGVASPAHAAVTETGTVGWVADGDTPRVDVHGDGTSELKSIRIIGIQAMEQSKYSPTPSKRRGECHALAATARAEQLVKAGGAKVRLTALNASSKSGDRALRSVAVKIDGKWQDIGLDLVSRGLALWLPFSGEWTWDQRYLAAAKAAAAAHRGLYDTDSCGSGPAQNAGLTLSVSYDPPGSDAGNLNGEWIRVHNPSSSAVSLAGWWVRDSAYRRYVVPKGAVVAAGGSLTVHVGSGRNTATDYYWGLTQPIFTNVDPANHGYGDGGYLFDPQGDLRAWQIYP